MRVFKNIASFLKKCSIIEMVKFVFVAGVFVFLAFFLMNFLLILIVAGILLRLVAPYFGVKFSSVRFKRRGTQTVQRFKVVGEEEEKAKEKNEYFGK